MTIAFISDLHLTPQRPESTRLFAEFVAGAQNLLSELYILGDLFEYWIGDDASASLGHTVVESHIRTLTKTGIKVYFMHGNRDFLINSDFVHRTGCRLLPDPSVIRLDNQDVLLAHGDALCTDDHEHQASRAQMHSSKWKNAFLDQSLEKRVQTAENMRAQSELAKQSKPVNVMDVNQNAVERLMSQHGVRVLIHGHTHRPAVHEFKLAGETARRYVLGDWYTQKSMLTYANGTFLLKR